MADNTKTSFDKIWDNIHKIREENTKRINIKEKTIRHKQSCNRDVGMLHGWQDKKSKFTLLSGALMLLIICFKDAILQKLGLK
jgi:hypothetical protein